MAMHVKSEHIAAQADTHKVLTVVTYGAGGPKANRRQSFKDVVMTIEHVQCCEKGFYISVRSCGICFFLSGLFH